MVRTRWWLGVAVVVLAGCGSGGGAEAATTRSPGPTSTAAAAGWTLPTGIFRSDNPQTGTLELHVEPGRFVQYEDLDDGTPDVGYEADCVADDPSTVTCTEASGVQLVFGWEGTDDEIMLTVVQGFDDDRRVWEGAPWVRVP